MPTTIRALSPSVAAPPNDLSLRKFYAVSNDPDFLPIIIFCVVGLAIAIFLTAYFSVPSDVIDLLG